MESSNSGINGMLAFCSNPFWVKRPGSHRSCLEQLPTVVHHQSMARET